MISGGNGPFSPRGWSSETAIMFTVSISLQQNHNLPAYPGQLQLDLKLMEGMKVRGLCSDTDISKQGSGCGQGKFHSCWKPRVGLQAACWGDPRTRQLRSSQHKLAPPSTDVLLRVTLRTEEGTSPQRCPAGSPAEPSSNCGGFLRLAEEKRRWCLTSPQVWNPGRPLWLLFHLVH